MERLVKKFEQRYRRALDLHNSWEDLQSRLLKQFANTSAILERLPVLLEAKNYGIMESMTSILQAMPAMQIEQLELILRSMQSTVVELEKIVKSFEKLWRDGMGLLKAEKITAPQSEQRVGPRPSLNDCLQGLHDLYIMHRDEHKLKLAIISSLSYESRSDDVCALQAVLQDQPNLPPNEVPSLQDKAHAAKAAHIAAIDAQVNKMYLKETELNAELVMTLAALDKERSLRREVEARWRFHLKSANPQVEEARNKFHVAT